MSHTSSLTVAPRQRIYREKLDGHSLKELAQEQHCYESCARRWWRVGRDQGLDGLHYTRRARSVPGIPSSFDPIVAEHALACKRQHPKRGTTRILRDLTNDQGLTGRALPKRSSLAEFFHQVCPELLQSYHCPPPSPRAHHVRELWQMDSKEHVVLQDGNIATVPDVNEPVACIFLGSYAHAVQTERSWRKRTPRETRIGLRTVFSEFGRLVRLQTDRGSLYGRPGPEAFPTLFTSWLLGFGNQHHFGRPNQPSDQPQVERGHLPLFDWMTQPTPAQNLASLQADLDTARYKQNAVFPSYAGDCRGGIPLQVHPEVLQIQQPYHPTAELTLFSLTRVDHFLANSRGNTRFPRLGKFLFTITSMELARLMLANRLMFDSIPGIANSFSVMLRPPKK